MPAVDFAFASRRLRGGDEALALQAAGVEREYIPGAVISGENAPRPMTVRGTLQEIAEKTRQAGGEVPAVIVIGGTAGMDLRG